MLRICTRLDLRAVPARVSYGTIGWTQYGGTEVYSVTDAKRDFFSGAESSIRQFFMSPNIVAFI